MKDTLGLPDDLIAIIRKFRACETCAEPTIDSRNYYDLEVESRTILVEAGVLVRASANECRTCTGIRKKEIRARSRQADKSPFELTGGRWARRGLTQVWIPDGTAA